MRTPEKLAYSVKEATEAAGIGRSTLYTALADSSLRSIRVGSRRLILYDDLRAWLESQAAIPAGR